MDKNNRDIKWKPASCGVDKDCRVERPIVANMILRPI